MNSKFPDSSLPNRSSSHGNSARCLAKPHLRCKPDDAAANASPCSAYAGGSSSLTASHGAASRDGAYLTIAAHWHSVNFWVDQAAWTVRFDLRARQNFNYRKSSLWLNSAIITVNAIVTAAANDVTCQIGRVSAVTAGWSGLVSWAPRASWGLFSESAHAS